MRADVGNVVEEVREASRAEVLLFRVIVCRQSWDR
jgi:hypothetical protein